MGKSRRRGKELDRISRSLKTTFITLVCSFQRIGSRGLTRRFRPRIVRAQPFGKGLTHDPLSSSRYGSCSAFTLARPRRAALSPSHALKLLHSFGRSFLLPMVWRAIQWPVLRQRMLREMLKRPTGHVPRGDVRRGTNRSTGLQPLLVRLT